MVLLLVPLLVICTGKATGDSSNSSHSPRSVKAASIGSVVADSLAAEVNGLLKGELEQEFGPLNDEILADETEIWGRVIAIDYQLPADKRLDDTWGDKVVAALGRLGITAEYAGSEVRAEQQTLANRPFGSLQFTTARGFEEPDVIGVSMVFPQGIGGAP